MAVSPNPAVMRWAMDRCGLSEDSLRGKWPKIAGWLDGSAKPTLKQAEDFSKKVHINLNQLFSEDTPDLGLQIADFRTVGGGRPCPSPELYDTIGSMLYRQGWMSEYFSDEEYDPVLLVGMFGTGDSSGYGVADIARGIREYIGLKEDWAFGARDAAEALRMFRDAVEARRISVVVNGIVGDDTHRPLDVEEFRGFVLSDRLAPIVFVNGRDAKTAQIFTLAHELAHLAFAETGVSSPDADVEPGPARERLCDSVAAEMLMPSALFAKTLAGGECGYRQVERAARSFKVSFVACARRARDLGLLDEPRYVALCGEHAGNARAARKRGTGGNYYLTKGYRIGAVFGNAVFVALNTNRITHREAYRLTGLSYKTFDEYFKGYAP